MKKIYPLIIMVILLGLLSCGRGNNDGSALQPNVSGSTGEVVVVIDKAKWDGFLGDLIRETLGAEAAGLPQSEPTFDLVNVTPGGFGELYITHRNIVFIQTGSDREKKVTVQMNRYASSQLIINLEGKNDEEIAELIKEQKKLIIDKINITERDRWISYYKGSLNSVNFNKLREKHKISLHVPSNYALDVDEKGFIWMSYETPTTTQSILVHYFDYNGENYFNEYSIRSILDNMTKEKVEGPTEGTWMAIEDRAPVQYSTFRFRDRDYALLKGLWTLKNGYMGGPFVCLVTKDEVNNRFVMLDGFVYAPNDNKRELLRQVEAILYTVSFDLGEDKK